MPCIRVGKFFFLQRSPTIPQPFTLRGAINCYALREPKRLNRKTRSETRNSAERKRAVSCAIIVRLGSVSLRAETKISIRRINRPRGARRYYKLGALVGGELSDETYQLRNTSVKVSMQVNRAKTIQYIIHFTWKMRGKQWNILWFLQAYAMMPAYTTKRRWLVTILTQSSSKIHPNVYECMNKTSAWYFFPIFFWTQWSRSLIETFKSTLEIFIPKVFSESRSTFFSILWSQILTKRAKKDIYLYFGKKKKKNNQT